MKIAYCVTSKANQGLIDHLLTENHKLGPAFMTTQR